jgi:putative transposase
MRAGPAATLGVVRQEPGPRDQSALRQRIRDIAMSRPRVGYLRVLVMLKREGWAVGKKRVYRLYSLEGLQLRLKVRRRKRIALLRGEVVQATGANQHWSMDFVHDQMLDGRKFRVLTVIDRWSRESVMLEANYRLSGRCVGQALDWAAQQRGLPRAITVDNGTEFTSKALDNHCRPHGSLGHLTPSEFATMRSGQPKEAAEL